MRADHPMSKPGKLNSTGAAAEVGPEEATWLITKKCPDIHTPESVKSRETCMQRCNHRYSASRQCGGGAIFSCKRDPRRRYRRTCGMQPHQGCWWIMMGGESGRGSTVVGMAKGWDGWDVTGTAIVPGNRALTVILAEAGLEIQVADEISWKRRGPDGSEVQAEGHPDCDHRFRGAMEDNVFHKLAFYPDWSRPHVGLVITGTRRLKIRPASARSGEVPQLHVHSLDHRLYPTHPQPQQKQGRTAFAQALLSAKSRWKDRQSPLSPLFTNKLPCSARVKVYPGSGLYPAHFTHLPRACNPAAILPPLLQDNRLVTYLGFSVGPAPRTTFHGATRRTTVWLG
ncbi:hypothetical protein EX30DRAFT_387353 [Ascodesmis nigricans]|uniref:Uncharacterized protein n=1 Tax=Ascodesmis nigricans TaxID=341454 RepID=A0A4S2MKE4_9PEZI|nr:hypothetical protein EX30DRAFT_387353 [Ascodesmis nigricans]